MKTSSQRIAVVVEQRGAEPGVRLRRRAQTHLVGGVEEVAVAGVAVVGAALTREVDHEQIPVAVPLRIGDRHSHARLRETHSRQRAAALEGLLAEGAVAVVHPQEVRPLIVGDVDVDAPIAVEVGRDHAQAGGGARRDSGAAAHVGEGAVAVVAIERSWLRSVLRRPAVAAQAHRAEADLLELRRPLEVVADEEIEIAVGVVVEETRRWSSSAGRRLRRAR